MKTIKTQIMLNNLRKISQGFYLNVNSKVALVIINYEECKDKCIAWLEEHIKNRTKITGLLEGKKLIESSLVITEILFNVDKSEINEFGIKIKCEIAFVISDNQFNNYFLCADFRIDGNCWESEEKLFDMEDELGDMFWQEYNLNIVYKDEFDKGDIECTELEDVFSIYFCESHPRFASNLHRTLILSNSFFMPFHEWINYLLN